MKERAVKYLSKNYLKNVGILECIKNDEIDYIYNDFDGVFIWDKTADIYMISTDSPETCIKAISNIDSPGLIVCHNLYEKDVIQPLYNLWGVNECWQGAWLKNEGFDFTPTCEIRKLASDDETVDVVYNNYTLAFDRTHIKYIIDGIGMYGAYVDGKLAGFIGRHEERSMGLLEVLPEYRKMGIGKQLIMFLTNDILSHGETPYMHIITYNNLSRDINAKLGFTFSDSYVYWLFRKNN